MNALGFCASFACTMLALAGFNAAGDPFADWYFLTGLRRPLVRTLDQNTDVKFKSRLVREAPAGTIEAAIFGSSRVMKIDPAEPALAAWAPHGFNLGIQGARLGQMGQFVDLVLQRNPRCVPIVGLDFFAFDSGAAGSSIYLEEEPPLAAVRATFLQLATCRTCPEAWKAMRHVPCPTQLLPTGLAVRPRPEDAEVRRRLDEFAAHTWETWPLFRGFHYDRSKIEFLRRLRSEHPRIVFFVNPVAREYREGQAKAGLEPAYAQWLADLASVGRTLDFSAVSEIVDNPDRYYDPHHYDGEAGAMILRDVTAFLHGEPLRFARLLESPAHPE